MLHIGLVVTQLCSPPPVLVASDGLRRNRGHRRDKCGAVALDERREGRDALGREMTLDVEDVDGADHMAEVDDGDVERGRAAQRIDQGVVGEVFGEPAVVLATKGRAASMTAADQAFAVSGFVPETG